MNPLKHPALHHQGHRRALKEIRKLRKLAIIVSEQVVSFMMEVCDRAFVIDRGRLSRAPREHLDAIKSERCFPLNPVQ